jgi:hypothetical protein
MEEDLMPNDLPRGLGAIQSPPDARDFPIAKLYADTGTTPPVAFPESYLVPGPLPPVGDQGSAPQCVAYSAAGMKGWQDRKDQGRFYDWAESLFFVRIGGTPEGAYPRAALDEMLHVGYPVVGSGEESKHRIAAYYAVPIDADSLKAALMSFGVLLYSTAWYWSWFNPTSTGLLRPPTTVAGGHAILIVGWEPRGLILQNSWGADWGIEGRCVLPWSYIGFPHSWEAWKSVDVIEAPSAGYRIRIAAGTTSLRFATLGAEGCIAKWTSRPWGGNASGAPCEAPVIRPGCSSGAATTARITAGIFTGRYIWIGGGVSVVGG